MKMVLHKQRFLSLLLLLSIGSLGDAWTQTSTTGAITGLITDATGAVVPDATVTLANAQTGLTRSLQTNADGSYTFSLLPVGSYDLSVSKRGFQTLKQLGIAVNLDQTIASNLSLKVGATAETVEVRGLAQLLSPTTSSLGQVVGQEDLTDLPLNGRNPVQLASLVVGATVVNAPAILAGYRGGSTLSVNGSRENQTNFMFDGNNYSSVYWNTGLNYPNPDALQEFKLITHNYSAEFGRDSGSVLAAITKTGTNQFHGDLWEFLRNTDLNARNYFSKTVPVLIQNQFGATAGGPIIRDKLFLFGAYQGFRIQQQALESDILIGTQAERTGNFSADAPIEDPTTGQPFPGNVIPPSRIISSAQNWYTKYAPLPNNADGRTFTSVEAAPNTVNQELIKGDWDITTNQTLSARWFKDLSETAVPFGMTLPQYVTFQQNVHTQDVSISHTWVINPTLLNQAHFGFNHGYYDNGMTPGSEAFGVSYQTLGINLPILRPYAPTFNISGSITGRVNEEAESGESWQIGDSLNWNHGRNAFKFGIEILIDDYHNRSYADTNGNYQFTGQFTGNALADFLLGSPSSFDIHGQYRVDGQMKKFYPFVQDDLKLTPRLTLNLGFRWELNGPLVDNQPGPFPNQQATWIQGQQSKIFPTAPIGVVYPGDPGVAPGIYPLPKTNLEPRVGFAWTPTQSGNWVVRGAFGLFSDVPVPDLIGQAHAMPPFLNITTLPAPAGGFLDPFSGYPGGDPWPAANTFDPNNPVFTTPATLETEAPWWTDPRILEWNLGVQRELARDWLFEVVYVGQYATNQTISVQGNPAKYIPGVDAEGNPLSTEANVNTRRIYNPGIIAGVQYAVPGAYSDFNALEVTVRKRMSKGLELLSSYTYSHSIDNNSNYSIGGIDCQNEFMCLDDRGSSSFDRKHVYAFAALYQIPTFPQSNWFVKNVLGNWQVSTIFTAGTNTPFTVVTGINNKLDGDNTDRPNLVGNPLAVDRSNHAQMAQHWFNPAAFVPNPIGVPGDFGRNVLRLPNEWNDDFSVLRQFPISEKWGRFEFRAEFFNLFNTVNLRGPASTLTAANFGALTSAANPRLIQFGLKYYW
jgi:Carboxypeptidase regulatory-like domain